MPQAAFSPQAVGCRYNPCEAGRPDTIGPDCAMRNHYTINLKKWRDAFAETQVKLINCYSNQTPSGALF